MVQAAIFAVQKPSISQKQDPSDHPKVYLSVKSPASIFQRAREPGTNPGGAKSPAADSSPVESSPKNARCPMIREIVVTTKPMEPNPSKKVYTEGTTVTL